MQDESQTDQHENIAERLYSVVDRMLEPFGIKSPRNWLGFENLSPPFDITKPNEHDNKAEFLREKTAIEYCATQLDEIVGLLSARGKAPEDLEMRNRLQSVIDLKLRAKAPRALFSDATTLVRRNVAEIGGYITSLFVLLDLQATLAERLTELSDQEEKFWSLSHRAPDYYARAIALRLAKLYAIETGQFPTTGTSGVTGEPSTGYTRALKSTFEILGMDIGARLPAEWAVGELTEDNLQRPRNELSDFLTTRPSTSQAELLDLTQSDAGKTAEE